MLHGRRCCSCSRPCAVCQTTPGSVWRCAWLASRCVSRRPCCTQQRCHAHCLVSSSCGLSHGVAAAAWQHVQVDESIAGNPAACTTLRQPAPLKMPACDCLMHLPCRWRGACCRCRRPGCRPGRAAAAVRRTAAAGAGGHLLHQGVRQPGNAAAAANVAGVATAARAGDGGAALGLVAAERSLQRRSHACQAAVSPWWNLAQPSLLDVHACTALPACLLSAQGVYRGPVPGDGQPGVTASCAAALRDMLVRVLRCSSEQSKPWQKQLEQALRAMGADALADSALRHLERQAARCVAAALCCAVLCCAVLWRAGLADACMHGGGCLASTLRSATLLLACCHAGSRPLRSARLLSRAAPQPSAPQRPTPTRVAARPRARPHPCRQLQQQRLAAAARAWT